MRSILFFICLIFTFEGQAQEVEKSHMWKVELSGALNNNSAWEVEPSYLSTDSLCGNYYGVAFL